MLSVDQYEIDHKTLADYIHKNLRHSTIRANLERGYARSIALTEMIAGGIVTGLSEQGRAYLVALYYQVRDSQPE